MALTKEQKEALLPTLALIIESNLGADEKKAFMDTAESWIDALALADYYPASHLDQIRLWLTAHFICIREPKVESETGIGGSNVSYEGRTGTEGLAHTRYGTQVLALEYQGLFKRAGQKPGGSSLEALG